MSAIRGRRRLTPIDPTIVRGVWDLYKTKTDICTKVFSDYVQWTNDVSNYLDAYTEWFMQVQCLLGALGFSIAPPRYPTFVENVRRLRRCFADLQNLRAVITLVNDKYIKECSEWFKNTARASTIDSISDVILPTQNGFAGVCNVSGISECDATIPRDNLFGGEAFPRLASLRASLRRWNAAVKQITAGTSIVQITFGAAVPISTIQRQLRVPDVNVQLLAFIRSSACKPVVFFAVKQGSRALLANIVGDNRRESSVSLQTFIDVVRNSRDIFYTCMVAPTHFSAFKYVLQERTAAATVTHDVADDIPRNALTPAQLRVAAQQTAVFIERQLAVLRPQQQQQQ